MSYNGNIKAAVKAGRTQRAAIIFDGAIMDVIGDERILLNDGFTLTQAYCTEENLIPGSLACDNLTARFSNLDGALTGFNFSRNAALIIGADIASMDAEWTVGSNVSVAMKIGASTFSISNRTLTVTDGSQASQGFAPVDNIFCLADRVQSESSSYIGYDVYAVEYYNGQAKARLHFTVTSDGSIIERDTSFTPVVLSDYAWARLESLKADGVCEIWRFGSIHNQAGGSRNCWEHFTVEKNGSTSTLTRRSTEFEVKTVVKGEQPRTTSGEIVVFTGVSDYSDIEVAARSVYTDGYGDGTAWDGDGIHTLKRLAQESSNNSSITVPSYADDRMYYCFDVSPYQEHAGLTNKKMFSDVCAMLGNIGRVTPNLSRARTDPMPFLCTSKHTLLSAGIGGSTSSVLALNADEYYSYDAADYYVMPIDEVTWKQTVPYWGTFQPDKSYGTGTSVPYYYVNNPLLDMLMGVESNFPATQEMYLSNIFDALKENQFGGYRPCVLETPYGAVINAGDRIKITLNDGTIEEFPCFVVTINWNGGANCTVESTGVEKFDQYNSPEFQAIVKSTSQAYRIAQNSQANASSINIKHDVNRLTGSGNIVENLRPVTFKYNFDPEETLHYGLIYEEVVGKFPSLVTKSPVDIQKKVNYQELVPILLAEIQDLRKRVRELEIGNSTGQNTGQN